MIDLDLTKPLRIIRTKERFYPAHDFDVGAGRICGIAELVPGGQICASCLSVEELENVPEPSFVRWAVLNLDSEGRLTHYVKPYTLSDRARQYNGTLIKLTRSEDGKTRVEVVE